MYALVARVLQDGGWRKVAIFRYSAIPPHRKGFLGVGMFSNTESQTDLIALLSIICGMEITTFISVILSLPRQFIGIYLGYTLRDILRDSMS
jgi:hypothetical protein